MFLKYKKINQFANPITKGHPTDAGFDFYIPHNYFREAGFENGCYYIQPGENIKINSGIAVEIPPGMMGLFLNKSGIASKYNLLVGAQVIDSNYSGAVHLDLHNVGNSQIAVYDNDKITQMVLIPIPVVQPLLVEEIYTDEITIRGDGGFGSTNK